MTGFPQESTYEDFETWRKSRHSDIERERRLANDSFVSAWAKVAYNASMREKAMGAEITKLQHRIGRQRKANRKLLTRLRELEGGERKHEAFRQLIRDSEDLGLYEMERGGE